MRTTESITHGTCPKDLNRGAGEDRTGSTPLHTAAGYGHVAVTPFRVVVHGHLSSRHKNGGTEMLLQFNADPNSRNGHQETPMHYAAAENHFQCFFFTVL